MSTSIQQKLLQYEVTPPAGAWKNIAAELDEAALEYKFPAALNNLSVTPPSDTWDKIVETLDNTYRNEDISAKLYAAEVIPPTAAWVNISAALDAGHTAPVPERRRLSPFIKYAAAAVVTGFLALGAIRFFNGDKKPVETASFTPKNTVAEAISHDVPAPVTAVKEENNNIAVPDQGDEARNDAALEASKHTYAKLDINPSKVSAIASGFRFNEYADQEDLGDQATNGFISATSPDSENANRYIVLMTPDGHLIRMSKKLSNLVCCVSGEEADQQCKSQMEKWRKQLACSEASHPGNFMDILSLVGSLQENQQ
ncbi:MAG: hypothetical protein U0U70_11700 [Chitinophagaceae bacterium]